MARSQQHRRLTTLTYSGCASTSLYVASLDSLLTGRTQALRGASGSFGIVTSTQVQTFEMPSTATTYTYKWELDIAAATTALNSYQEFAASNIPKELGIELLLGKGDSKGSVSFSFTGVWYGGPDELASVLQPLLDKMGPEDSQTSTPGTYLDSATTIAGGSLDTGDGGPGSSAFYAKSLVTPEAMPMTSEAHEAFMTYVANEGFDVEVVSTHSGLWKS